MAGVDGQQQLEDSGSKAHKMQRRITTARVVLAVFAAIELFVVSWCALTPVWDLLPELQTLHDWLQIYSVSLSNLDVWVATMLRSLVVLAMVGLAPSKRVPRYSSTGGSVHGKLRLAVSILTSLFEAGGMGKAALVAVTAPEQAWPTPPTSTPAGTPTHLEVRFAGLVYMYTGLVVAVLGSLLQSLLADLCLARAQALVEAPAEPGSVEAPLLGAGGALDASAGTAPDAPGGSLRKEQAGVGGEGGKAQKSKEAKQEDKTKPVSSRTVLMLVQLSAPDWPMVAVAFGFGVMAALAQAFVPYYTGLVIDYASIEPNRDKFQRTILALLLVAAACGVATGCRGGLFTVAMSRLNVRLRKQLFHALLQMEVGFFDVTKTGEITSRLAADTSTVSDQVCLNLNVMLRSITQATMVLGFMFTASWRLTVVTFIVVPAVMAISKVYGRYFAKLAKRVQGELAEANSVAEEVLSTMTTVKAHAAQDSAEAQYAAKLEKFFALLLKEAMVYAIYMIANTFLPSAVAALVLFYGGRLVLAGQMSPGALVSFMLYQQSLSSAFQMLADVFGALTAAVGAADKVLELMARKPQVDAGGQVVAPTFVGHVELRDVHFYYPARPQHTVLRGLNLVVEPGQVVALVGPSGGGKSSIVKLVERFYLPQSGVVLLDGRDVGVYNPKWLRRQVALVSQEPVLYGRSVRRNIVYGLEAEDGESHPPTQEDVEEAAKQANAHDFICAFPDGYDTDCGEKGVTLSGGQKQRLAIARALVRKPRVLLLDEATSALDADSEAVVQEALDRVMAGRTVLVIAHRLSTIQEADKIFVIAGGVVQEVGTHVELLANSGVYATLVRRQIAKSTSLASLTSHAGTGAPP